MNKKEIISLIKESFYWIQIYNKAIINVKDRKLLDFDKKYGDHSAKKVPMFSFAQLDSFNIVIDNLINDINQLIKIYDPTYGAKLPKDVLLKGEKYKIQDVKNHIKDAKNEYHFRVNNLSK